MNFFELMILKMADARLLTRRLRAAMEKMNAFKKILDDPKGLR